MLSFEGALRPRWWRSATLLVALSLGAAACGSGDAASSAAPTLSTASADAADESGASTDSSDNSEPSGAGSDSAGSDSVGSDSVGSDSAGSDGVEDAPAAEPVENLFPDVDVVNIADGSSVNLAAELGGGDKATLLWFWAPH